MAYTYQMSFYIEPTQMNQLQIGEALETAIGYLRALLPSEPGFITARDMRSIDLQDRIHLILESEWNEWADLKRHREQSYLEEDHLLTHFKPHIDLEEIETHIYEEIA